MNDLATASPVTAVLGLAGAHFGARALHIAAEVGVADALGVDEAVDAATIAARIECHPGAIGRVLRALAAHGLFATEGGVWRHNEASVMLRADHPQSVRAYARMVGGPMVWGSLTELRHSVRTGEPAAVLLDPGGSWAYLAKHPDEAEVFNAAMTAKAHADAAEVLASIDIPDHGTVVDVGGGRGHLLDAWLDAAPGATGVLFDLPPVVEQAIFRDDQRLQRHAGDFFVDPVPTYDIALLMTVIHDWADAEAVEILRNVRAAAHPTSRVFIIDAVVDDNAPDAFIADVDIAMMAITGGVERTADQFTAILTAAGLAIVSMTALPSGRTVVEARPA